MSSPQREGLVKHGQQVPSRICLTEDKGNELLRNLDSTTTSYVVTPAQSRSSSAECNVQRASAKFGFDHYKLCSDTCTIAVKQCRMQCPTRCRVLRAWVNAAASTSDAGFTGGYSKRATQTYFAFSKFSSKNWVSDSVSDDNASTGSCGRWAE